MQTKKTFFHKNIKNQYFQYVVIGDLILDKNYTISNFRFSKSENVHIHDIASSTMQLGGSLNLVNSLASLRINFLYIGIISDCKYSKFILKKIKELKINYILLKSQSRNYINIKNRYYYKNKLFFRFDEDVFCNDKEVIYLLNKNKNILSNKTFIISDYSKGIITDKSLSIIKKISSCIFVDPKKNLNFYHDVNYIFPNSNYNLKDVNSFKSTNSNCVIIHKMSDKGFYYNDVFYPQINKLENGLFSGAGDTFLSYFIAIIEKDFGISFESKISVLNNLMYQTLLLSNKTVNSNLFLFIKCMNNIDPLPFYQNYLEYFNKIKNDIVQFKVINGKFDILHYGHLRLLGFAENFNDNPVVILLNSDKSIQNLNNVSYHNQLQRVFNIKGLKLKNCLIFLFDEKNPIKIIKKLGFKRTLIFKGPDYKNKNLIEYKYISKNKFIFLKTNKDHSSSEIRELIKNR